MVTVIIAKISDYYWKKEEDFKRLFLSYITHYIRRGIQDEFAREDS